MFMKKIRFSSVAVNRNGFEKSLKTSHHQVGVVVDGDCPEVESFLITVIREIQQMSRFQICCSKEYEAYTPWLLCGLNKFFSVKHHWLITTQRENTTKILEKVPINVDADLLVAVENVQTADWTIFDVYNPAFERGGVLNSTPIGYYQENQGFKVASQDKYWARKNLSGVRFKAMIVLPIPFKGSLDDYLSSDEDRDVNTFNRFHNRLIHFCQDYYNFSMDIRVDKSWGYTLPNGSFDGMVGALEHRLIDFGLSPLFVREDRGRVIEYGRNTAGFLFRHPKVQTSMDIFLRPFSTAIWLITAALSALSVLILKAVTTFERNASEGKRNNIETTWSLSMIFTWGAFCQQGAPTVPGRTCGRIATMTIFLLSLMIYQFYSASIVSNLLMKPATTIKSIKDLLESSLRIGCEDILYNKDYFQHTSDAVSQKLYRSKILRGQNSSNFLPPEEGLQLVRAGGYAFHVELATAYPIIEATFPEKAICELREVQLFRTQPMHANYQKNSPFRDLIDTCLQREAEFGILFRERRHWHPRRPECSQSDKSMSINVGLGEFYPALILLIIGFLISLIVLVLEKQIKIVGGDPAHPPKVDNIILPFVE